MEISSPWIAEFLSCLVSDQNGEVLPPLESPSLIFVLHDEASKEFQENQCWHNADVYAKRTQCDLVQGWAIADEEDGVYQFRHHAICFDGVRYFCVTPQKSKNEKGFWFIQDERIHVALDSSFKPASFVWFEVGGKQDSYWFDVDGGRPVRLDQFEWIRE